MIYDNYPKIDLHGYDRDYALILVKEFINDNIKLDKRIIVIVHGKGKGILKRCIHEYLKKNKSIKRFEINMFNDGETIVYLK